MLLMQTDTLSKNVIDEEAMMNMYNIRLTYLIIHAGHTFSKFHFILCTYERVMAFIDVTLVKVV